MLALKRAGDYVMTWSELVDENAKRMFGGTAATKSTLVKRGPKDQAGDSGDPPSKRVKLESGTANLDDDVKRSFERGAVAKVSYHFLIKKDRNFKILTMIKLAHYAHSEGVPDRSWPCHSW
jgi:hypothetical protein